MKLTSTAKHQEFKDKKLEAIAEKKALREKLAEKFGDRFKAIKKNDATVVISKEAVEKAQEAKDNGSIKSNDPNSEETKDKLRGLLRTGSFKFNDKERDALEEILG